ncbi:hypothetical protein LTR47_007101, partial [Exophiala xenobiotica]
VPVQVVALALAPVLALALMQVRVPEVVQARAAAPALDLVPDLVLAAVLDLVWRAQTATTRSRHLSRLSHRRLHHSRAALDKRRPLLFRGCWLPLWDVWLGCC